MTVALSDVCIINDILSSPKLDIHDTKKVTSMFQDQFVSQRKPLASTINILAFALYAVFCAPYGISKKDRL